MDLNNKYFVVRFLEKPYSAIDSEVCVPFNWVKVSKKTNDIISVAYPAEYSPSTRELVRNICTKRDEWHCYKAQVKCGKRSFEAAERFIKSRNQTNPKSEKTESSTAEINESKSGFNINSSSSKENSSPSLATKNPILRNNQSDSIKLSVKRLMTNISLNDLLNKPMKTVKTSELISETPNHSNGSGKSFCENKLASLELDCLNQNQHDTTDVKMSDFVSKIVEQTVLESSTENKSSSIPASHYCHTHLHRSPARHFDSLHHNLQSQNQNQNQLEPSSAKVQILGEKIMITSNSNVANPSSEGFSHNNQLFKVNRPVSYSDKNQREISIERSLNAHDNVQEMCPNITTITYPSALYRLREKVSQKPLLLSHPHNEQLLTIKAMDINQKPRRQIIHRPGEVNPINDRIYPQSALDQEARTQIVIDESTEVTPIEQSDSSKITTRKVLNTLERNRHNPGKVTSIYFKNPQSTEINAPFGVRKSSLNSEIPIEIIKMNKNSQHQEIRENTPTAVQNCSSSSNQSSCPWNGFSGKESSLVTQDQFISDPCHQQRHIGKPSKLNYTEKSIYFKNNTNNETSSVQSTLNTKHQYKPIKKYCKKNHLLAYEHDTQEQFSPNSEDFPDQEMHTEEIAAEKMSENNHIVKTSYPEIYTEQESKIPNLSNSIYALPEVKIQLNRAFEQMLIDRYLSVQQNNITESVLQELPVKAEEKSTRNENKKTNNLDLNYVADESDEDDDDNDDSNYGDYCVDNKHKDDINENDNGLCELPKKKRGKKRSFVLPPEYNPHDSRWTLKYQAKEPGVVELVPHSKIYISDLQLANCKREANDYKTFGRKLLVEVFSRKALSVCSLTGARANAFDVYESDIRPGLDKEARSTLLTYVQKYGREQGWGQFDTQSVVNSLRNKIQDFRYKYGSTV